MPAYRNTFFEKTEPKATWRKTHRQYISTHIITGAPIRNPNMQNKPNRHPSTSTRVSSRASGTSRGISPSTGQIVKNKPNDKVGKMQPDISPWMPWCLDPSAPYPRKQTQSAPSKAPHPAPNAASARQFPCQTGIDIRPEKRTNICLIGLYGNAARPGTPFAPLLANTNMTNIPPAKEVVRREIR